MTAVLIGQETASRPWVKYEIEQSIARGNGLLGVNIYKIKNQHGEVDDPGTNPLSKGYVVYNWNNQDGAKNLGAWIETAAKAAGK